MRSVLTSTTDRPFADIARGTAVKSLDRRERESPAGASEALLALPTPEPLPSRYTHVDQPADLDEPILKIPQAPTMERASGFPTMMVIAPIIVASIMYAMLRTPYVLIFAVFGPVFGIANVVDQRIGRKRRYRRALEEHETARSACRDAIRAAHRRIRARAASTHPAARSVISGVARPGPTTLLGHATTASGLRTSGGDAELEHEALRVREMPFVRDITHIRVTGNAVHLQGFARAMAVQLLASRVERSISIVGSELDSLLAALTNNRIRIEHPDKADCRIEIGNAAAELVDEQSIDVVIDDSGEAIAIAADGSRLRFWPDTLGEVEFNQWLPRLYRAQLRRSRAASRIPERVWLRDLLAGTTAHDRGAGLNDSLSSNEGNASKTLRADFLVGSEGIVPIDLVIDGAHALVAGTTGSGKSELLISWIASLCHNYTPGQLAFLGLDFKGGATFDSLSEMPHCRGVVTDLDGDEAMRVAWSLRAEVERRERALRQHQVRDILDTPVGKLERLVVFVDEYQALVHSHPDLQAIIADLAARGRSLGVHLVLCTQRPTGTYREELLANCSIRLSLRVEQASDSVTMLGNSAAATIDRAARGRAMLRIGGGEPEPVQVAQSTDTELARIAQQRSTNSDTAPLPIWHPPLPERLTLSELGQAHHSNDDGSGNRIVFGRLDMPESQSQPLASIGIGEHLYVVGGHRSGKSVTLATLREGAARSGWAVVAIGSDVEHAWDAISQLKKRDSEQPCLVTVDDLDALEALFDDDHRAAWMADLLVCARLGKQRGITFVFSGRRATGTCSKIHQLCTHTLLLTLPTRNEWILQGGQPAHFANMVPGRGRLDGVLIQVALATEAASESAGVVLATANTTSPTWRPWQIPRGSCIVARRTSVIARWLEAHNYTVHPVLQATQLRTAAVPQDCVMLGDVEQWISAYGVASKMADTRPVIGIGLTPGEWRSLFRGDSLPPALAANEDRAIVRAIDGTYSRIRCEDGIPQHIQRSAANG